MSALILNEQVGRYQLCRELASGGMATVYLAKLVGPGGFEKFFAVKRVHPHLNTDPSMINMFLDEARLAARISHPNVCQVVDFGVCEDNNYFLAMNYIVGETLLQVIDRVAKSGYGKSGDKPSWPLCAAHLMAGIAEGLHKAHSLVDDDNKPLHVVHRDVTPSNIFITHEGASCIVDFGIAKANNRIQKTQVGQVKGKLGYLAPEQTTGVELNHLVDIWGMGVCLWEALALRRLFSKDNDAATITAMLHDEIEPPSKYNVHVPPELDMIVMQALQRDPEKRHQSARELAQELRRFVTRDNEMIGATEIGALMRRLFPKEIVEVQRYLKEARQTGSGATQQTDSGAAARPGGSKAAARPGGSDTVPGKPIPLHEAPTPALTIADIQPQKRSQRELSVAILIGVAVVGLVLFVLLRGGDTEQEAPSVDKTIAKSDKMIVISRTPSKDSKSLSDPAVSSGAGANTNTKNKAERPAGKVESPKGSETETVDEFFVVKLQVEPDSALIEIDGIEVGTGGLVQRLARDGKVHNIVVQSPGYHSQTITFADTPPPVLIRLQAIKTSRRKNRPEKVRPSKNVVVEPPPKLKPIDTPKPIAPKPITPKPTPTEPNSHRTDNRDPWE